MMIRRILIANRGEIASRIIRTCRSMGIFTIAIFSEADRFAPFVSEADISVGFGTNSSVSSDTYLNPEKIIQIAKHHRVEAIHPGYGFLSENPEFARACQDARIIFIGPSVESIECMGSKIGAKLLLADKAPEVPLIPGYNGQDQSHQAFRKVADSVGYPVLLKAALGGGGKGMEVVSRGEDMESAVASARRIAISAFKSDQLLMERYFPHSHHVEIQIFGDAHGNVVSLGHRDCSIQRRHQKIIEETPSVLMTPDLYRRMSEAAVKIGKTISYKGAGTVEFLVDSSQVGKPNLNFYFLEVNTRLQVEHPVTEMVTGLDLVKMQIEVAAGKSLPEIFNLKNQLSTSPVESHGASIECRIYAEDQRFFPSTGEILKFQLEKSCQKIPGIRIDLGYSEKSLVSVHYDPMIAKVIVHDENRNSAIFKMKFALKNLIIFGVETNVPFLLEILNDDAFVSGNFDTHFIADRKYGQQLKPLTTPHEVLMAALFWNFHERKSQTKISASNPSPLTCLPMGNVPTGYRNNFYKPQRVKFQRFGNGGNSDEISMEYQHQLDHASIQESQKFVVNFPGNSQVEKSTYQVELREFQVENGILIFQVDGKISKFSCFSKNDIFYVHTSDIDEAKSTDTTFILKKMPRLPVRQSGEDQVFKLKSS
eukprot:TRINITY_DN4724_c1_g1_i1.p1 TRINITY_DN4724_c1_g1~~TRINITY_DN4724_c1_g1_i1.p1  ORF type:complete len:652 (+),score=210.77 TRINITY_DN4724_c1_g1_i1:24-1979(+)